MRSKTPNPAGRHGKPIIIPTMPFEDALRKVLSAEVPKELTKKKPEKRKTTRKK